jgi:hypothetical protein
VIRARLRTERRAAAALRSRSALPVAQLVAIARDDLRGLGDPQVKTAFVVATRKNAAENWLEPRAVPPDPANPRVYVIMLRGNFTCEGCLVPPGGKPIRAHTSQSIWVPGVGIPDGGLGGTAHTLSTLSTLGKVIQLALIPPSVPDAERVLQPGSGIGAARFGASLQTVNRKLGPALARGEYVLGSIEISVHADRRSHIDQVAVRSPQATVDGHPLSDGYARLRRQLKGWRALNCRQPVLLNNGSHGISTRLEFTRDRFTLALIGIVPAGRCYGQLHSG